MIETDTTLRDLLVSGNQPDRDGPGSAVDASHGAAALKDCLAGEARKVHWDVLRNVLVDKLAELLNIRVVDILVLAWRKYGALAEYTDPSRHPPEEVALVPLADHTVRSDHHPYLEVLIDDRPIGKITFDITLAVTLRGFELKLQGGKIKAIQTGSWQGKAGVALEKAVIYEKTLDEIRLPGSIDLGEGLSLGGRAGAV